MNVISLGAGVQSSTMALMAAAGEITPMPDCAIFADTQSEPAAVYQWLDWLEKQLPFPVYRVTAGSLRDEIINFSNGKGRSDGRPPFHTLSGGMVRRQCTGDFKITPIIKKVRALCGLTRKRAPNKVLAIQWIGISTDEAARMKQSQEKWISHRWPLVEMGMSRRDCETWLADRDFGPVGKSACTFCPYHNDAMWREMKKRDPVSFADAVSVDAAIRNIPGQREAWFVHRSRVPLDQVDFSTDEDRGQLNMFNNECEGMCGV